MQGKSSNSVSVEFGPFAVDLRTGDLKKDGQAVRLPRQARMLLRLLVASPGEVVTREQIQGALWPDGTVVDFDQSINFCVKRVRAALGDDAAHPSYVDTVAGTGYRFVAELKTSQQPLRRRRRWMLAAPALVALGLVAFATYDVSETPSSLPRVSVLPFENRTGDPELDWLRLGLSEMLTTELAESREIEVTRGAADTVVRGSFVSVGDQVRIDAHVEEEATATIVGSEKVAGRIEEDLLSMMDHLAARVRLHLEVAARGKDFDLASITTSSAEAYRFYIEGLERFSGGDFEEAVPHFEEALRFDPEFATAMVNLAAAGSYLGTEVERGRWAGSADAVNAHWERRRELTARAFELSHRLPGRERLYIEGQHHRMHGEDERAIEAYERTIRVYPDHLMARLTLAARYVTHHEFEHAAEQMEQIRNRSAGFRLGGIRSISIERYLARAYTSLGRLDEAYRLLEASVEKHASDPEAHEALGEHLVVRGKLEEAAAAFEHSKRLGESGRMPIEMGDVHILREEWERAEALADENAWYRAILRLYRGRSREALSDLESIAPYERIHVGWASRYFSETLLQLDRPSKILEFETEPVLRAVALARLGRLDEAEAEARPFRGSRTALARLFDQVLAYEIARTRGNAVGAVQALERAERLLSPRGIPWDESPLHGPVWYRLASAYLAADETEKAEKWLERIVQSPSERLAWPIPYVRSFYLLGQIHEDRGDLDEARRMYRRFYELWKDGDLDRERVGVARERAGL